MSVQTVDRIVLQCTQCPTRFTSFDPEVIKTPPEKPKCIVCERLIKLGLQEEK